MNLYMCMTARVINQTFLSLIMLVLVVLSSNTKANESESQKTESSIFTSAEVDDAYAVEVSSSETTLKKLQESVKQIMSRPECKNEPWVEISFNLPEVQSGNYWAGNECTVIIAVTGNSSDCKKMVFNHSQKYVFIKDFSTRMELFEF